MNYSNEYIINELMNRFGYNKPQAKQIFMRYDSNDKLDDLAAIIEAKQEVKNEL